MSDFFSKNHGAVTLPVVLLIGGLIMEMAIAGAFLAYFLSQSGFGVKLSAEAFSAAQSGIEDAKLKIVRDKNFTVSPNPYDLTIGNRTAEITVCKNFRTVSMACDTAMSGKYEITSLGSAMAKRRQLRAIFYVDDATGEVKLESLEEIAL
jgi:uncharacterized protein (UPF0333 family)